MGVLDLSFDVLEEYLNDFAKNHRDPFWQSKTCVQQQKNAWFYYKLVRDLENFLQGYDFFDNSVFCYEETINLSSMMRSRCQVAIQVRRDAMKDMGVSTLFPTLDLYVQSPHNHKTVGLVMDDDFFEYAEKGAFQKNVFKILKTKAQAIKDFVDGLEGGIQQVYQGTKTKRSTFIHVHGKVVGLDDFLKNKDDFLCYIEKRGLEEALFDGKCGKKSFKKII